MNNVVGPDVHDVELRLVRDAAAGDRDARSELFVRYRDVAFRVAFRITGDEHDALDVVQDGYIKAFDGLAAFSGQASFKTWLLRIVTNRALDHLRSKAVRRAVSLDDNEHGPAERGRSAVSVPPGAPTDQRELAGRVERAMGELPPAQRAVMALYAGGELTYGQIAEIVDAPIGTVMSRIYHARRRLQELLPDLAPY